MKVSHINYSDNIGGASKAAKRLCEALAQVEVDAKLIVANKLLHDQNTIQISSRSNQLYSSIIRKFESYITKNFLSCSESSLSIHPSNFAKSITKINSDINHFHWINGGFLSLSDIVKIEKPRVWTLHDMWPFCATEHYSQFDHWKTSYSDIDSNFIERKINQFVWKKKNMLWKQPFEIVTPSRWMADCAKQSMLFSSWPISVIKNPIDTDKWHPLNKNIARKNLGLPLNSSLILYGSAQGTNNPRKGYEYLNQALRYLKESNKNFELVVFGNSKPLNDSNTKEFKVHDMGMIADDERLKEIYQSCDVFVLPSLQDNLPNTCVESISCGTPVCAFNSGGVEDIVINKKTGYLAKKLNARDLADGINWILSLTDVEAISEECRKHAVENFSYPVISKQYKDVYDRLLSES